jgi:molybdopterin synthase catalytic subunit
MTVTVQFFSYFRQHTGRTEMPVELPPEATVGDLVETLGLDKNITLVAVGVEFVKFSDRLHDGDVVSLMPPLQGGTDADELLITDRPIDETEASLGTLTGHVGGVVTFWGVVRDREDGQPIRALDYTAYREMADHQFRKLLDAARQRWPVQRIRVIHRLGVIPVGAPSLLVRVEAAHRAEAFAAAQFIIDELKQKVPIWKQSVRQD